jgi:indole-3-glycerol phosphate synthase
LRLSEAITAGKTRGKAPVIAEIKVKTPRDGDLLRGRDPVDVAKEMEVAGATALSVVTEPRHFGGSLQTLRDIARCLSLPILRKDFITTKEQVYESRESGAGALLLILSMTPHKATAALYDLSKRLGMETVIEVHSAQEMREALSLNPKIIGINNRNITMLETDSGDVSTTERLTALTPENVLVISESSIETRDDVRRAMNAGADAVLVGTALMKAPSIEEKLEELMTR